MLRTTRVRQEPLFAAIVAIGALVIFSGVIISPTYSQVVVGNNGHSNWTSGHCENDEDCKIEVKMIDGERIVIVNGDTVETGGMGDHSRMFTHTRSMFDRLLADRVLWHKQGDDLLAWFGGDLDESQLLDRPHARVLRNLRLFNDSTLREMESEAKELAQRARLADHGEKAELRVELDEKLSEIFDYKNGKRLEAIGTAEKRLDEMRERQSKRESSRADIIDLRKQELLGEESHLEW